MQKTTVKKLSILGLVLMGASAVTAAIMPNKAENKDAQKFANGSLTRNSLLNAGGNGADPSMTCTADTGAIVQACQWTETGTTGAAGTSNNDTSSTHAAGDNDANIGEDNTSDAS